MYFGNYGLAKTCLDKGLKSPVWEHRLTINMLKSPKDWWNLHASTFIIFFDHYERSRNGKCLS